MLSRYGMMTTAVHARFIVRCELLCGHGEYKVSTGGFEHFGFDMSPFSSASCFRHFNIAFHSSLCQSLDMNFARG